MLATLLLTLILSAPLHAFNPTPQTILHQGVTRTYYTVLPGDFDPGATYWPLVVVHGGGGKADANKQAIALRRLADESALPAILILPEFITKDKQVSRFPALGEDAFLKAVLADLRTQFKLRVRILLTGYSMGGQFTHRFALANPELVQACATFAAGTWTTPDGKLLIEEFGEVVQPREFLLNKENARLVPERLHDLFNARTAAVAGLPAAKGAEKIPFLVMCGTLDPRHGISVQFFESLLAAGYTAEAAWPATPHSSDDERLATEFAKYPETAISFFLKHANHPVPGN